MFGAIDINPGTFNNLNANLMAGTDAVKGSLQDVSSTLTVFAGDIMPYLVGIAGAFLVFWLLKLGIRVVKSFNK